MSIQNMQAQTLINYGYHIVPLPSGSKGPVTKGWQNKEFTAADINAGIGIKCGIGAYPICAIDIDVLDSSLVDAFVDYCTRTYGMTVERVGQAPKTMLVYRAADEGWSKRTGQWFTDSDGTKQRIEILGKGQQFVAYHIHPDTNQPYEWVDLLGGLDATPADELPILTADDVDSIIATFDQMAVDAGLTPVKSQPLKSKHIDPEDFTADSKVGLTRDEAKDLLEHLDASDYDRWLQVGMALHHEFDGDAAALALYDSWSSTAPNYLDSDDIEKRWASFGGDGITARTLIKWGGEANAKYERDIKKNIVDEYKDKIADCSDAFELEDTLHNIGRDLKPDEVITCNEVKAAAKAKYKSLLGQTLTDANANKLLGLTKDTSSENLERQTAFTEFGNAKRMLDEHGDNIMFTTDTEMWYRWTGSYWRVGSQAELEQLAKDTILMLLSEGESLGLLAGDQFDFIKASLNARMMSNMVKILRTEKQVLVSTDELDANKMLFGCANGSIDLTTGKLLPPDRLDRITLASRTKYNPNAECPLFEQTVSDAFYGDEELIAFFQRLMGYTLLGDPKEDIIVIPYGTGSNGKSTILGAIRDTLGAHALTSSNETFLGRAGFNNAGGPRDDILRLRGSRFVYVTEPDDDRELKEGLIKSMTGGEAMAARAAYSRVFVQFTPTWTVVMPTNHKPIIKGDDFGIWRRIMLIPFTRNFSTDPDIVKDADRSEKLKAEYEGILAWLVRGTLSYLEMGLQPPAIIEEAREEYKGDMDLLAEWMEECCVIGKNEVAKNAELWASWKRFADERGELKYINTNRALIKKLESRGSFQRIRDTAGIRGRGVLGISVKDMFDDADASPTV